MTNLQLATTKEIVREFGSRLRAHRMASSMTQDELATRAGVALGSVKKLESTGLTTLETFVRVAQTLSLVGEFENFLVLRPRTSIAEMERAELSVRKRAPRRTSAP